MAHATCGEGWPAQPGRRRPARSRRPRSPRGGPATCRRDRQHLRRRLRRQLRRQPLATRTGLAPTRLATASRAIPSSLLTWRRPPHRAGIEIAGGLPAGPARRATASGVAATRRTIRPPDLPDTAGGDVLRVEAYVSTARGRRSPRRSGWSRWWVRVSIRHAAERPSGVAVRRPVCPAGHGARLDGQGRLLAAAFRLEPLVDWCVDPGCRRAKASGTAARRPVCPPESPGAG
jgi:hypothetical protein